MKKMATFNPLIFHTYDIRGIYPKDFDAAFAQQLGSRIAAYLDGPRLTGGQAVVVGRDGRSSSDDLAYAVIDGALHTGAQVIDIGLVSTPQFYWAIRYLKAAGGIMVTASHNPGDYNGFKVIGHDGQVLGGHEIRQIYDSHQVIHRTGGSVRQEEIIGAYAAAVRDAADWDDRELQLAIDGPVAVRKTLEHLTPIAPDHGLAAKFDPDGDRIVFYDHAQPIAAEWIFLLLVEHLKLSAVVFDLLFSRVVRERLDELGIHYEITRVGHLDIIRKMRKIDAFLGAEISGHYYWKPFSEMESPELVLLQVMRIVQASGESLGELVAPYMRYTKSETINIPIKDQKAGAKILQHIKQRYRRYHIDTLDGVTVDAWDSEGWWFTLRPSNTEPVMRLVVETKKADLLQEKVQEIRAVLC